MNRVEQSPVGQTHHTWCFSRRGGSCDCAALYAEADAGAASVGESGHEETSGQRAVPPEAPLGPDTSTAASVEAGGEERELAEKIVSNFLPRLGMGFEANVEHVLRLLRSRVTVREEPRPRGDERDRIAFDAGWMAHEEASDTAGIGGSEMECAVRFRNWCGVPLAAGATGERNG